jgi:hypothetical protein
MSFYVEKPISLVSDLKSSAIQAVKPVFHFLFYLSHMFVVIKTDEKINGYVKGKGFLKLILILRLFPFSTQIFLSYI